MHNLETTARISADGTIHVAVPASFAEVNDEVRVTIEPPMSKNGRADASKCSREEHREFIRRTAGAWLGEFERPEQLTLEEREWWP